MFQGMNRKMAISAAVGITVLIVALLAFRAIRPIAPPAVVSLIGFTNSPSGGRIARFQLHNQSMLRIARNGYCRLDGRAVDIPLTKTLEPGDTEIVELPLASRSGGTVEVVRFNGVREGKRRFRDFGGGLGDRQMLFNQRGKRGSRRRYCH